MTPFYYYIKQAVIILILLFSQLSSAQNSTNEPVILAYFPSWSENFTSTGQDSKLRRIPPYVNYVFLAFAKPDLIYQKDSFDLQGTGIQVPYDGCTLKESISALKDKGIKVILSVGGETYWTSNTIYENIKYQQIKDLVDDFGFAGIDWDFEPNGSFANIGSTENVQHFIDFFNNSRAIMPKNEGYILACAPSGVGALGGLVNNDIDSPYAFENRNTLTGENDDNLYNGPAQTNGINLFGFSATGHMIPVIKSIGDKIDLIAYQGYNAGGSNNRAIMYDAFAYYAEIYNFKIAAGIHYPDEPWGPYYEYSHENVASLSNHIATHPNRAGKNDGIMIWQLLLEGDNSSAYSYLNVASKVLNGIDTNIAIDQANDYSLSPYTGGSEGCGSTSDEIYCEIPIYNNEQQYPNPNTKVYYSCKIWENQWFANPNEIPGENNVWIEAGVCEEEEGCDSLGVVDELIRNGITLYINNDSLYVTSTSSNVEDVSIMDLSGKLVLTQKSIGNHTEMMIGALAKSVYIVNITLTNKKVIPIKTILKK